MKAMAMLMASSYMILGYVLLVASTMKSIMTIMYTAHNADNFWIGRKKMFEDIERIIVETEEGEEIATIINDDKIDESIIVADGYTVRIKPKSN